MTERLTMHDVEEEAALALEDARCAGANLEDIKAEAGLLDGCHLHIDGCLEKTDERLLAVCGRLEELATAAETEDGRWQQSSELLDDLEEEEGLDGVVKMVAERLRARAKSTCPFTARGVDEAERLLTLAAGLLEVVDRWDEPVLRDTKEAV